MSNPSSYEDDQSLLSRPIVRFGLIWGVWTIVTLFFSTQAYIARDPRRPMSYLAGLLSQASACYLWAIATPLVLWLARRYRIERHNWMRRLLLHLLLSLGLVSVILVINYPIFASILGWPISWYLLFRFFYVNLDQWLLIYWVILFMSHAFNYYNNYRKGELKASELRTQLVQSQLEALKMQVHPHFLFNTLHSISALLSKDTEGARKMIMRLGDFLRLTLENSGSMEVTLQTGNRVFERLSRNRAHSLSGSTHHRHSRRSRSIGCSRSQSDPPAACGKRDATRGRKLEGGSRRGGGRAPEWCCSH